QAEDGIRDLTVTGVQTCALPICGCGNLHLPIDEFQWEISYAGGITLRNLVEGVYRMKGSKYDYWYELFGGLIVEENDDTQPQLRSEERRVGKEWRYRTRAKSKKK